MSRLFYLARLAWVKGMDLGHFAGCHQLPERSFSFRGYQFPVCARCTGTFAGELLCLIAFFGFGLPVPSVAAVLCAMIMLFDWVAQQLDLYEGSNMGRFFTGILGGMGCWSLLIYVVQAITYIFI